ncbi:phosphatase PAP2 family protein [Sphingomonas sp. MMS24-J13]|uniref:phosphatase PAP2 family protein n=1 Tax=Sphingomonas sp. MMS24-J13 TaxID=3238686 RepID=UPI00384AB547
MAARSGIVIGALLIAAGLVAWATGFDCRLHGLLRVAPTSPLRVAALALTKLGGFAIMGPFGLAAVLILLLRKRWQAALWLFLTVGSGRLIVEGIKVLVTRPRPPRIDWLDPVASWSFPSSHSAGAMMTCVALAMLVPGRLALGAAIIFAVSVGWSRIALGVHWPGDVLAGWGFGLLWTGLAAHLRPAQDRPRSS